MRNQVRTAVRWPDNAQRDRRSSESGRLISVRHSGRSRRKKNDPDNEAEEFVLKSEAIKSRENKDETTAYP